MQLVDEKDDALRTANLVHHRFDAFFKLTTVFCAGDHQCQIERDHSFIAQKLGHIAVCDLLRESFSNRRFADTRFTDQDRIIFRPSAKHLDHALDFIAPANHRIELAFPRQISQVTSKCAERRSLDIAFCWFATFLIRIGRHKIRIELFENFVAGAFDVELQTLEYSRCYPFAFA